MNELTESLDRAEPFPSGEEAYNRGEDCWIVDTIVVEAARKWAEVEAGEVFVVSRTTVERWLAEASNGEVYDLEAHFEKMLDG